MENLMSIYELAKFLEISVASVNYYTNLGFFNVKDRKGNRRLYDKNEIFSIYHQIRQLRKKGYTLKLIQQRLEM
ncbi:MAG: MerR family transcriptional regulator [Candidatus Omnitrophota bacterium]